MLSLASAQMDLPVAPGVVAIGEVSLTGELRPVTGLQQRLAEASRLGFTTAITPPHAKSVKVPEGMTLRTCNDIMEALKAVLPVER